MHPTEDKLLGYAIGTLNPQERREIEDHLATCAECRDRETEIARDIELLAGIRVGTTREYPPMPVRERIALRQWMRLAAVLVLGFAGGAIASAWWRPDTVVVVPMPQIENTRVMPGSPVVPGDALGTTKI